MPARSKQNGVNIDTERMADVDIGQRIKHIRNQRGLTSRKLAEASGISASLLSQIESGRVDPSVSSLRKIAAGLDVQLFHLVLDDHVGPDYLVRAENRKKAVFPSIGLEYEIVHSHHQKKMGIMVGRLSPGGRTNEEPAGHQGEECVIVITGRMTIDLGLDIVRLGPGDSFYFDSSIPHTLTNDGGGDCRFYLIITPPRF